MRKFIDTETGKSVTEPELLAEFTALKSENPEEYPYNFNQYLRNCTDKNGFFKGSLMLKSPPEDLVET